MQTINKKAGILAITLFTFTAFLSSFSLTPGGDKIEIYINNKMVLEQFVSQSAVAKTLTLTSTNYSNKVDVKYSHCGKVGTGRSITIKDGQNKLLMRWQFADGDEMSMKAKDIIDLKKKDRTLQLFYTSKEIPNGKLLASVVVNNSNYASIK